MKFIIDAQLPKRLSNFLKTKGFDSIHTLELPKRNLTSDSEIIEITETGNRVLITKDSDFYESKLIKDKPKKLVLLVTGNIHNDLLISIFDKNIDRIIELLNDNDIIEVDEISIISK